MRAILLTLAFLTLGIVPSLAAEPAQKTAAEVLLDKNVREFEEWRRSIPDYDKRLYDRVKQLQSRSNAIAGLAVTSVVLNVLVLAALAWLLIRGPGGRLMATIPDPGPGPAVRHTAEHLKRLERNLHDVRTYLADFEGERARMARVLSLLEAEVAAAHRDSDKGC